MGSVQKHESQKLIVLNERSCAIWRCRPSAAVDYYGLRRDGFRGPKWQSDSRAYSSTPPLWSACIHRALIKVKCDLRPPQKAAMQAFSPRFRSRDCRRSRPIHVERLGMLGRNMVERLGMLLDRRARSRCSRKTDVFKIDRNAAGAGVRLVDAVAQISPHRFASKSRH